MALGNKTLNDLLAPISKQLGHAAVAAQVAPVPETVKPYRVTDGMSQAELVDKFVEEAEKIRVGVTRCASADLAKAINDIVTKGVPEMGESGGVIVADEELFAKAGVYDALKGNSKVSKLTVWDASLGQEMIDDAYVATFGITYAVSGVAESASVVQPTSEGCGRTISLLPLVHIAVVDAKTIKPTMLEVLQEYKASGEALPMQICFISGPSATADIELVRVEGVHGPMYVNYIVLD